MGAQTSPVTRQGHALRSALLAVLTLCVVMAMGVAPPAQATGTSEAAAQPAAVTGRIAEGDRYATAAAISRAAFPQGAPVVYLARGDVFSDALAAGQLTDGPVLLVRSRGTVPGAVRAEIDRLGAREVIALGGSSAVCDQVLRDAADGRPTARLGGTSRYATAAQILRRAYPLGSDPLVGYVANGADSPDALAGGGLSDGPLILARPDGSLHPAIDFVLRETPVHQATALGGPAVVPDSTLLQVPGAYQLPDRLYGKDRYGTAVEIAGRAYPRGSDVVYLARGDMFADAVAAGSLSFGPVLLVRGCGALPATVGTYLGLVRPDSVMALGGQSAVCDSTLQAAAAAAGATTFFGPDVAAGVGHTCAVTDSGAVRCWGHNGSGALGDGTTTPSPVPVPVLGLGHGSTASVDTGGSFSCALRINGSVRCWGSNSESQIPGAPREVSYPAPVPGLGVGTTTQLALGQKHGCAIGVTGATRCWGSNSSSQLGLGLPKGGTVSRSALVPGLGPGQTRSVAAGYLSTCAVRADGAGLCWGSNVVGTLGDGTTEERNLPTQVVGLGAGTTADISVGTSNGCAVTTSGATRCWGEGSSGALGNGERPRYVTEPVDVVGLGPGTSADVEAAGSGYACAVTTAGGTMCWGSNSFGQIGAGEASEPYLTPQAVLGLGAGSTARLDLGSHHVCAVTTGDEVRCWGDNYHGQIGDGTYELRPTPVPVPL